MAAIPMIGLAMLAAMAPKGPPAPAVRSRSVGVVHPVRPRPEPKRHVDARIRVREAANAERPASRRLTVNPKKVRRAIRAASKEGL